MPSRHTDREYEHQLQLVRETLLGMAGYVESMIASAVRAVVERNADLARETIEVDRKVDAAEVEIDERCLLILAKRQPLGSDLRFITFSLKMVTDLERVGDLAVNICERAIDLAREPELRNMDDIGTLGRLTRDMIRDAIDAFVAGDVDKAKLVVERDDLVDERYQAVFSSVLDEMRRDPSTIQSGIHVQSIAKWLERMGDHATNLAEFVVFMVQGSDIRHSTRLSAPPNP